MYECYFSYRLELEVVQLVAVLHDVALDLGRVDPGHEVFHVSDDCQLQAYSQFSY
jgi:hypothetical protein